MPLAATPGVARRRIIEPGTTWALSRRTALLTPEATVFIDHQLRLAADSFDEAPECACAGRRRCELYRPGLRAPPHRLGSFGHLLLEPAHASFEVPKLRGGAERRLRCGVPSHESYVAKEQRY